MTKGKFIELVLLRVNGGNLPSDSDVWRVDIEAYLPAVTNYVTKQKYFDDKNQARLDRVMNMNDEFLEAQTKVYREVPVSTDQTNGQNYIELPSKLSSVGGISSLKNIRPQCGCQFSQIGISDCSIAESLASDLGTERLYYVDGDRVYFMPRLPIQTKYLVVSMVPSADDLSEDDELPLPVGYELEAIALAAEHFTAQRFGPADNKPDEIDNKNLQS